MTAKQRQRRFESLLHAHRRIVFKVAAIYAHNEEDRRDLAQEICTQLWRSFPRYDERRKFSTWMYRIALNVGISNLRRQVVNGSRPFEPLEARHLDSIGGEPAAEQDERVQMLYAFIERLDVLNRALILLYLEDRSYAEIADILGSSETNVATRISRIKQKLRRQMTVDTVTATGA